MDRQSSRLLALILLREPRRQILCKLASFLNGFRGLAGTD